MQAARRIYVYLMSGISLGTLVAGVAMLIGVLLGRLGLGPSDDVVFGGDDVVREQLTLATALIVVSLPAWLIHWSMAERSVRPDRPDGLLELNAPERGLYFALAFAILLAVGATAVASAIDGAVLRLAGADAGWRDIGGDLGRAAVALGFWGYHLRIRERDWSRRTLTHQAAFLPRAYRYVAALVGLLVLAFGIGSLVDVAVRALVDDGGEVFGPGGPWWSYPLGGAVASTLVGGAIWVGHWADATRIMAIPGPRGESEGRSQVRLAAFVATIVATAAIGLTFVAMAAGTALELALGVASGSDGGDPMRRVLVPLLTAVPFLVAWGVHTVWLDAEPIARDLAGGIDTVDRLRLYPTLLVGLAFLAVGAAWLIRVLLTALSGSAVVGGDDVVVQQLAQFVPVVAIGLSLWAWRWPSVAARARRDPLDEAQSTTRRSAILVVLGVCVLAAIAAGGTVLYRLFGSLFGVSFRGDVIAELSLPIGVLVVAAIIGIGFGRLLRSDSAVRAAADAAEPTSTVREVVLRLTGPADGMERAMAALGSATPSGFALEQVRGVPPSDRPSDVNF
jgi:hypothetical protein